MNMALLIPSGDNLVTYYLLPLIGVNKNTFGRPFKSSFVNQLGTKIFVELHHPMVSPIYREVETFETEVKSEGGEFVIFNIPTMWRQDTRYFIDGLYSKMSKVAKKLIYNTSTLPYNLKIEQFSTCHPILQALGKTKVLREHLLEVLNIEVLADSGEFIDKPPEDWFIEHRIEMLKKVKI